MAGPIVFVHGLFHAFGHLRDPEFHEDVDAMVVDLLGYGVHARVAAPPTLDAQVDHLVAELDRRGVSRAAVVGHSIGGAVTMLAAARYPHRFTAVVNVEGNFTLADAFWSSKVAAMAPEEVEHLLAGFRGRPDQWLDGQGIAVTPERLAWTERMFAAQPAASIQRLARAVVEATGRSSYLTELAQIPATLPIHLLAGERSRSGWDVPDWMLRRAASFTIQPGVGHMMSLEEPREFLRLVRT